MDKDLYQALKLIYEKFGWENDSGPKESGWQSPPLANAFAIVRKEMSKHETENKHG